MSQKTFDSPKQDRNTGRALAYGDALFADQLAHTALQGQQFRRQFAANFGTVQNSELAGDAKARSAAINFLSTMGGQAREAELKSANPDLGARLGQLNTIASHITGEPDEINARLQKEALSELDLGGQLSPDELRNATQDARAGWNDRGLLNSNPALISEVLNRGAAEHARLREREGFATAVDGATQAQITNDRNFLTTAVGVDQAVDPAMSILGINSTPYAGPAQSITESSPQTGLATGGETHDFWNTLFNDQAAQKIAAQNRAAALQGAQIQAQGTAAGAASAQKGQMTGALVAGGAAIAGAAIIAL